MIPRVLLPWLALLLPVGLAAQEEAPPPEIAPDSPLAAGPMVGHVEMRAAFLWVQTKASATVDFEWWDEATPERVARSLSVVTEAGRAFTAAATAAPLEPGRSYRYRVRVDGREAPRAWPLRFQTPPLWQWRTDPPDFTVATGSCLYINDPPYDRPGKPYGGEYHILQSIVAKQPQVMLWLGDNCYLREADFGALASVIYRYSHTRATPRLQPLLGACANYAIWDDHDFGPNDSDRSLPWQAHTRQAFDWFWANPTTGLPENPRLRATMFSWGDADFFLLDDRTERAPNARRTGPKPFLGAVQLRWLLDALVYSTATWKVVCVGNQVLNPVQDPLIETYARYAEERKELLDALRAENVPGVLFLTGDRHASELTRLEREGTYPLYDLTISPLTAGVTGRGEDEANTGRIPGTYLKARNFALLRFLGPADARALVIQVLRADGSLAWERRLEAKQLR